MRKKALRGGRTAVHLVQFGMIMAIRHTDIYLVVVLVIEDVYCGRISINYLLLPGSDDWMMQDSQT